MRKIFILYLLLVAYALLLGCATYKAINSDSKIVFGNYGGFTGAYSEFIIFGNGDTIFKNSTKDQGTIIRQLNEEQVLDVFQNISAMELYKLNLHDPGNLSYFLKFEYKNTSYHLLWGGVEEIPENLKKYYNSLATLTKDRNPIM